MTVTTINGEEVLKSKTRKIKREDQSFGYYKIGNSEVKDSGDCYRVNGIYYTMEKGRIVWNYNTKCYVLKSSTVEGIVDVNMTIGYFSRNENSVVVNMNRDKPQFCITKQVALDLGLIQGFNGEFYNPRVFCYKDMFPRQIVSQEIKTSLHYNFKNYMEQSKDNYNSKFKFVKSDDVKAMYSLAPELVNNYTFGIELETTRGMIPEEVYSNLGVMPVRDGSISGLEYVTIPLNGEKGLYAFKQIMEAVIKYTDSDYTCSMHVHVGGIPRTMEFIVAMFKFAYLIQRDVFPMFPRYKEVHDGLKRQCYTSPLNSFLFSKLNFLSNSVEKVKEDYTNIVHELSGGYSEFSKFVELDAIKGHPSDPSESSKWHMKERYKWINLIPLIFTNKQTVEYRIFTMPDTIDKAMTFLFMSLAITDFVKKHQKHILSDNEILQGMDLRLMFDYIGVSRTFAGMINERKSYSARIINRKGAHFEESDLQIPSRIFRESVVSEEESKRHIVERSYSTNYVVPQQDMPERDSSESVSSYLIRLSSWENENSRIRNSRIINSRGRGF